MLRGLVDSWKGVQPSVPPARDLRYESPTPARPVSRGRVLLAGCVAVAVAQGVRLGTPVVMRLMGFPSWEIDLILGDPALAISQVVTNLAVTVQAAAALAVFWVVLSVAPGRVVSVDRRWRVGITVQSAAISAVVWGAYVFGLGGRPGFVQDSELPLELAAIASVPVRAASEEVLFRGLILLSAGMLIARRPMRLAVGGVGSVVLFGWVHYPATIEDHVSLATFSLMALALVVITNGLEAAVVAHTVFNLLRFVVVFPADAGPVTSAGGVMLMDVMAKAAIVVLVWLVWRRRYARHSTRCAGQPDDE